MPFRHAWLRVLSVVIVSCAACSGAAARAAPARVASAEERLLDGDLDFEDLVARATVGRGVGRSTPGGETYVSLLGFTRQAFASEREVGGMVVVGVPLDKIVRVGARTAGAGAGASAGAGAGADAALALTPRLARMCVGEAWRAAGMGVDDARLDAIVARARWSALLPETRLRAIRYDDERLYTDLAGDVSRLRDSAGANLGLEARLTWRLDRLLYSDDEPSFERMRLERHDARSRIAAKALDALFHWQRAWVELRWAQAASQDGSEQGRDREAPRSRDEIEASLRVMEAEATLDVLTAGWFSAWRAQRAALAPPVPARPEQGL